jgi:flagellin-like hook-associated protein FlgL
MASNITLSSAVRSNLLALQDTADLLGKTQEKLATGLKVNSALDDPTAFFTASSLNGRANDLSRLQDFVGNAVQTIKAADEGISAITKLVESAEATARQALQSAGNTATATGTVDTTANGFFDFTATSTSSNTVTTTNFDDFAGTNTGSTAVTTSNFDDFAADATGTVDLSSTTDVGNDIGTIADGDQFTIQVGSAGATTITIDDGESAADIAAELNALSNVSASINGTTGFLEISTTNGESLTLADSTNTPLAGLGLSAGTIEAQNSLGISNGDTFTVDAGSGSATTITFGADGGSGEVNTLAELEAALDGVAGVQASVDGSDNLVITTDNGEDLTLAEGTNNPLANLGITAGTSTATNTLGVENGDSFDISVGSGAATTITFGADGGSGEVNTQAELLAALNGISGVSAEIDGSDNLVITSTGGENLTFAENSGTPLADLGITAETVEATSTSGIELGDTFTVQVGSAAATTITFGTGSGEVNSADEVLAALNAITDVTATVTDDGFLNIEATNGEDLILAEGTNTPLADYGLTAGTTAPTTNSDRASFATQFNELRTQIDELADDASFNGINLLDGDNLTVTFNEDATSTLGVDGVTFNSNGLGISSSQNTFQTDADINAAISDLKGATDTLRAQASKFGSNLSVVETRQDFTKNLINVLETGAANLTLADTNEEGANLLALQTRQQLSSTALSLASQADQNVLQLF